MRKKIGTLLQILHHEEQRVAAALTELADRHRDDHELFHVANELATWSTDHVETLVRASAHYETVLAPETANAHDLFLEARRELEHQTADDPDADMLLLRELRELHLVCVGLSVDWEMLAQAAKAVRDDELLKTADRCQSEAVRQLKWANAMVKQSAPQIMAS